MRQPETGSIRVRARRLACENSKFNIYLDSIEAADGHEVKDYLVVSPKCVTPDGATGVSVLPVMGDRFGLIRIYRHPMQRYLWEVPRGFIENGETETISALRELAEETGLECAIANLVLLGGVIPEPGVISGKNQMYAALNCTSPSAFRVSELGHEAFRLVTAGEYEGLIEEGEIMDPSSIIAYYKYREYAISHGKA